MKRVLVLVEGQTEETFVRQVLAHHLHSHGVHLQPIVVATKRIKSGRKFKGGIVSYRRFRRDLVNLLTDSDAAAVTTMIDYYGLPDDFPGVATLPAGASVQRRARHLERALRQDLEDRRLFPYFSIHEFEALLLAAPEQVEATFPGRRLRTGLAEAVTAAGSPEEVDDGEETHPAARIRRLAPGYRKALHGPVIAERIGLDLIRDQCRHFDGWLSRLEGLGAAPADPR